MEGIVYLQEFLFFKIATGCQVAPKCGLYKPAFLTEKSDAARPDYCPVPIPEPRSSVPWETKGASGGRWSGRGGVSLLGLSLQRTMNRNVFSLGPGGQNPETAVSRATPRLEAQERVLPASTSFWESLVCFACGSITPISVSVRLHLTFLLCSHELIRTPAIQFRALPNLNLSIMLVQT